MQTAMLLPNEQHHPTIRSFTEASKARKRKVERKTEKKGRAGNHGKGEESSPRVHHSLSQSSVQYIHCSPAPFEKHQGTSAEERDPTKLVDLLCSLSRGRPFGFELGEVSPGFPTHSFNVLQYFNFFDCIDLLKFPPPLPPKKRISYGPFRGPSLSSCSKATPDVCFNTF